MFMRFVHLKAKPEGFSVYLRMYETRVIPTFEKTPGCLYAGLIQNSRHVDEFMSMTLWDELKSAQAYERSGTFAMLMNEAAPFLADSEWKIQLAEDLTLQYQPVAVEPTVQAYHMATEDQTPIPTAATLHVRLVSPQIRPGKFEEFKKIYNEEILAAIRKVKGCRYVCLSENEKDEQVISVSIWDNKSDADAYEQNGVFAQLTKKVAHTFSEVYQWKMQLGKESRGQGASSGDMKVEGYSILVGKSFL